MAKRTIRELVTKWGFKVDQKPLIQMEEKVENLKASFKQVAIIGAAAGVAIGFLLKKAGDFEQTQIAFETMLQSQEKSAKLLKEITEFAKKTPFELIGLLESSKRLLAFGFEGNKVINTLKILGNISAGVGRDKLPRLILALGQVRAATRLKGTELRQFTEAGVPLIEQLAKTLQKPEKDIQKLVSLGQVGFKDVLKALESLTTGSGRFANLMDKQSKSFLGMISNIKDFLGIMSIEIGTELLPEAKKFVKQILVFLEKNQKEIKKQFVGIAKALLSFIKVTMNILIAMKNVIMGLINAFGGLENVLRFVTIALSTLMGLAFLAFLGSIPAFLTSIVLGLKTMGTQALIAQAKLLLMPIAIGLAIAGIILAIEDLIAFFKGEDSVFGVIVFGFQETWNSVWEGTKAFFGKLGTFVKESIIEIFKPIGDLFGKGMTRKLTEGAIGGIGSFFGGAADLFSLDPEEGQQRVTQGRINRGLRFGEAPAGGSGSPMIQNQISAPIEILVPAGTSPEEVGPFVRDGIKESLGTLLRETSRTTRPQVEF